MIALRKYVCTLSIVKAYTVLITGVLFFFAACKQDSSEFPERLAEYLYFCPNGPEACYDACWAEAGDPPSTGPESVKFDDCVSNCRFRCDMSSLLMVLD